MQSRAQTDAESRSSEFFRARLLSLAADEIVQYIERLEQEAKTIRQESLRLTWYMRGGITYEQIMQMSSEERGMIGQLAKDNIETTKKTKLPWF